MKKVFFFLLLTITAAAGFAQLNPVSWTYTAKKIANQTYELHITASIQSGWHLYSQVQPDDAIAEPTLVTFNKNPLLTFDGKIREEGKLEKFHDATLDVSANQYSTKVNFVQVVKLKAKAKTKVSGNVRFQTCNDEKCLPPKTVTFSVAL
ncbi:MAG TPA: protein-disulfide reductase DsbD domain-containing protein [Chitinophagaceae bacterium]